MYALYVVSLAGGGPDLGAMWGKESALEMFKNALCYDGSNPMPNVGIGLAAGHLS